MQIGVEVNVPVEVLGSPLDSFGLCPESWDPDEPLPDQIALRWVDSQPFASWSVTLLSQIDPVKLPATDLPTYHRLSQKAQAFLTAKQYRAVVAMAGISSRGVKFDEVDTGAHELVCALKIPLGAAQTLVYRARRLATHLPGTQTLFDCGALTERHVVKMIGHTGHLSQQECGQVEDKVLAAAPDLPVAEFARRVRRAVAKIHPRKTKERHDAEAANSDVTFEPDDDAMCWLNGRMPTIDGLIVKKACDHYALARKKTGDPRPIGVLRAEALRMFAEAYLSGQLTGTVATHHGRPVEIQVAVTPEALLGMSDTPGEIPGVGPIPIELIRAMIRDAKIRWLTISAESGRLLDRNSKTWRIPPDIHAFADTAYPMGVGPCSTVPAERCDGEHLIRHPDGPTSTDNVVPMDRGWHRPKTHKPGMRVKRRPDGRIVWTTPLGQTVIVDPYDYRLGP
jgi:hypothetical protein